MMPAIQQEARKHRFTKERKLFGWSVKGIPLVNIVATDGDWSAVILGSNSSCFLTF